MTDLAGNPTPEPGLNFAEGLVEPHDDIVSPRIPKRGRARSTTSMNGFPLLRKVVPESWRQSGH